MQNLIRDLRYGYRTLLRNPGFAAAAVISLALGIGANTAIFSFVNTLLLRNLPVSDPESLVILGSGKGRGNMSGTPSGKVELFSWRDYKDLRAGNSVFTELFAVDSQSPRLYASFNHSPGTAREEVLATPVSGNFFSVLGVHPAAGRFFGTSVDAIPGSAPFAVLSDTFWARRFHRDPAVIGSVLRMADRDYTILGATGPSFFGTRVGEIPDLWIPIAMKPTLPAVDNADLADPMSHFVNLFARTKAGVTLPQATANANLVYARMLAEYVKSPGPSGPVDAEDLAQMRTTHIDVNPASQGLSGLRGRYAEALRVLMGVVALVLLVACANVANLLVAMGARRQREMAVRLAIGAGRGRVVSQVVTEGLLLAAAAGVLGILVATGAGQLLVHLISTGPRQLPLAFDLDLRVLAFTVAISAITGILFSLAPAIRASRVDLNLSLKEGKGSTAAPGRVTFGRVLVVAQVALSLTLLVSGGLLVRSFRNLLISGTGFDRENVLVFKIDANSSGYKQDARLADLYTRIEQTLAHLPGVTAAAFSQRSFSEGRWMETFTSPGITLPQNERVIRQLGLVSSGYFKALRIPVLNGRGFNAGDSAGKPWVAVVNATFAKQVFGNDAVIGRVLKMGPIDQEHDYQVVGIVGDIKSVDVRDTPEKQVYIPIAQNIRYAGNISIRIAGDPQQTSTAIRRSLTTLEPNLPVSWVTTLAGEVGDSLVRERAVAQLASAFALVALLLSAIGLFGTVSFAVARRTNEIGIRIALGAERSSVLFMVLLDTAGLLAAGLACGIPLAFLSGRLIQALLFGVGGFDPATTLVACTVLILAAGVAGYIPARRAAALDPTVALRCE